jgi:hypothetical protein
MTAAPMYPRILEFVERALRHAEPQISSARFIQQKRDLYEEVFDNLGDSRCKVLEGVLGTISDPHMYNLMLDGKPVGSRTLDDFARMVGVSTGELDEYSSKPAPISRY